MPNDDKNVKNEEELRSGRTSVSDEEAGVSGIKQKAIGGYGADDESVDENAHKPPLSDNAGEPALRRGRDTNEE